MCVFSGLNHDFISLFINMKKHLDLAQGRRMDFCAFLGNVTIFLYPTGKEVTYSNNGLPCAVRVKRSYKISTHRWGGRIYDFSDIFEKVEVISAEISWDT